MRSLPVIFFSLFITSTALCVCDTQLLQSAQTIHDLKLAERVTLSGYRFNEPYKETIGCSDGNPLFVGDYVPAGECLGVPVQDEMNGEYKLTVIKCE